MKFNEKQTQKIYDFLMNYNLDDEHKKEIENLYDNDINKLSILFIYALEEILRYGNKSLFAKFVEVNDISNDKIYDFYDEFIKLINENDEFKKYKLEQLNNNPETLSRIEMFALSLINNTSYNEPKKDETVYVGEILFDDYNPILYGNDSQIRETLGNLLIGELVFKILDSPKMKDVKLRQIKPGIIDLNDKKLIINEIKTLFSNLKEKEEFNQVLENRFSKVKLNILVGKKEEAFMDYLKYNTNISVKDIFGDTFTEEDKYEFIKDMFRRR